MIRHCTPSSSDYFYIIVHFSDSFVMSSESDITILGTNQGQTTWSNVDALNY